MAQTKVLLVEKTWDDQNLNHEPVNITIEKDSGDQNGLIIRVRAPFFNCPQSPEQTPGDFFNLRDYEGFFYF
jgi:hypothetical protein